MFLRDMDYQSSLKKTKTDSQFAVSVLLQIMNTWTLSHRENLRQDGFTLVSSTNV